MLYSYASIDSDKLTALRSLEKEIGAPLIAMQAVDVAPAQVGGDALERIKELEEELGVVLVAVTEGQA